MKNILYKKFLFQIFLYILLFTLIPLSSTSNQHILKIVDKNGSPIYSRLMFAVKIHDKIFYIYSRNGYLYIDEKFMNGILIGPLPYKSPIYLPIYVRLSNSLSQIVLYKGGVVKIVGSPLLLNENIVPSNIIYRLILDKSYRNIVSQYNAEIIALFNNSIVIPADTPCIIELSLKIGDKIYRYNFSRYLNWNNVNTINLYKEFYRENYNHIFNLYNKVLDELHRAEDIGFYLGFEEKEIGLAEKYIELSKNVCNNITSLILLRKAQLILYNCRDRINQLYVESSVNVFILSFIISLSIFLTVSIFFEDKRRQTISFIAISILIFAILELIYPSFRIIPLIYRFSPIFSTFIIMMLVMIGEDFPDTVSPSGVALIASISVSIKLGLRNLKKRKVRSILLILSIIILYLGIFSLTSFNISLWIQSMSKPFSSSFSNIIVVRKLSLTSYTVYSPLSNSEIEWIRMNNVTDISIRMNNVPRLYSYTIVGGNVSYELQGLMAFTDNENNYINFREIFIEKYGGHFINQFDEDSIMLSEEVVKYMNLNIGDRIYIYIGKKKYGLKLIGIFDGKRLAKLTDPSGEKVVPLRLERQDREIVSVLADPNLVGIVSFKTGLKLGLKPYILTGKVCRNALEMGEAIAILLNLYTVVVEKNVLKQYFPGKIVELKGSELLIPISIVFLNMFLAMLDNIKSRRKEMEIMSSIGVNPTQIELIFISESIIIGLISSGLAYLLASIIFSTKFFWILLPQINVKINSIHVLTCIAISILTCILASIIPSLKISAIITPSLQRKWRIHEMEPEKGFIERLPVRIPREKIKNFIDFLEEKLRTYNLGVSICEVDILEKNYEKHRLTFIYKSTATLSRRACNTYNEIYFEPEGDFYRAYIKSIPKIYVKVSGKLCSYETISLLRKISLEWTTRTLKILAALGKDIEPLYYLIKEYQPSHIVLLTLSSVRDNLKILRKKLFIEKIPIPAFETIFVDNVINSFDTFIENVWRKIENIETFFVTTDIEEIRLFITILAIKNGKTIIYLTKLNEKYVIREIATSIF